MRILVAEDSPTAALALRKRLEEMGQTVVMTKNGREAWEHLQSRHEWLVITDWMMPEMDGPELCRKIRARKNAPYTYVIIMTVKDLRKDRFEGLKAGADSLLVRVFTASEVTYTVETSSDLRTWTPTATNTGPAEFSLKFLPGTEGRFLRAARR